MLYVFTLIPLIVLDFVWLTVTSDFYRSRLSDLFAQNFVFWPALIFYPLYAFGLYHFVVQPATRSGNGLLGVFLAGALFGVIAYATYDITNQATLRNWPLIITIVDMAWGAVISGLASTVAVAVANHFK